GLDDGDAWRAMERPPPVQALGAGPDEVPRQHDPENPEGQLRGGAVEAHRPRRHALARDRRAYHRGILPTSQRHASSSERSRACSSSTAEAALVASASQRALSPPCPRTASRAARHTVSTTSGGASSSRTRRQAARIAAATASPTSRGPSG